jgi:hypothetical protein
MEIKFELDTEKSAKATIDIATAHALSHVLLAMDLPQLAAANAPATIIIITILYGPRLSLKHSV